MYSSWLRIWASLTKCRNPEINEFILQTIRKGMNENHKFYTLICHPFNDAEKLAKTRIYLPKMFGIITNLVIEVAPPQHPSLTCPGYDSIRGGLRVAGAGGTRRRGGQYGSNMMEAINLRWIHIIIAHSPTIVFQT